MIKNLLFIAISMILLITACKDNKKEPASASSLEQVSVTSNSQMNIEKLYGSWVERNPADSQDIQGFTLKGDSIAESINQYCYFNFKKMVVER